MLQPATDTPPEQPVGTLQALELLMQFAEADGDISPYLTDDAINRLTDQVMTQYEADKQSRKDWEDVAQKALADMVKCDPGTKDYPWANASNVHYPLLAFAVMQFNARAYPAIVKGDEAVNVKVVGADKGLPLMGPDGQPVLVTPDGQPVPMAMAGQLPPEVQQALKPAWQREPGAKAKRAQRVQDYMNTVLFYRMDNWEGETDTLLFQLPAIGVAFRKTWFDGEQHNSTFVPAMRLVVDNASRSLADAPQIAEEIEGEFPHLIRRDIATGKYRDMPLDAEEKDARLLIEVQCHFDLDGDGMTEPYIVTIDHKDRYLLRVVPDFGPEQIKVKDGQIAWIDRRTFYTKYEFLPQPEGKFYNPGLAHLLDQYGAVVNTLINQMIDANHAATAGGGFIASGLRIQGQGQSSTLRFRPGEYKTVSVQGSALREGIVDRTTPQVSPVAFNLLDLILGAAKDIASVKDILSGDASNNGQVGTTLALIEQGLQVFTAIYKRVYRGLKGEFALLFANIGKYATQETAQDYLELLDDPAADFARDFATGDMDIRPISDPASVTKMQKIAKAQFLLETVPVLQAAGGDVREALRRSYEAADVEDIDKLLPEADPMAQQMQQADAAATIKGKEAKAAKDAAEAQAIPVKVAIEGFRAQGEQQIKDAKMQLEAFNTGAGLAA